MRKKLTVNNYLKKQIHTIHGTYSHRIPGLINKGLLSTLFLEAHGMNMIGSWYGTSNKNLTYMHSKISTDLTFIIGGFNEDCTIHLSPDILPETYHKRGRDEIVYPAMMPPEYIIAIVVNDKNKVSPILRAQEELIHHANQYGIPVIVEEPGINLKKEVKAYIPQKIKKI